MSTPLINVLLTSFPGLGLPRTLNIQVPATSTVAEVEHIISRRLPDNATNLNLTTTSNKLLSSCRADLITSLLDEGGPFLPLRLSASLCGGKGGFGSQLRAAGGRMSSRKKRGQGEQNGSARTIDGRRIRTVNEAKALAEYLAIKPEMDKREREERRNRLEEIVRSTEARKAEILNGSKGRMDGEWLESKEEAAEKAREAVLKALREGDIKGVFGEEQRESDTSGSASDEGEGSESEHEKLEGSTQERLVKPAQTAPRRYFGWDEDELSDSEEEEEEIQDKGEVDEMSPETIASRSKGKAKV
ncbi:uncharacterized protein PV09_02804 [Verruconis gallopava]|uniref:Uncharacterized protein n=1 Tax=Verruconis gallopava TaxID=253628 RepID=A0A0D1Z055_9PEZI|nr:uncharacterized protein PV09_02804 [Verruconis gallopava]KIW06342.1 hypothetical protein PV09_02804 [Verruconis gallopava]